MERTISRIKGARTCRAPEIVGREVPLFLPFSSGLGSTFVNFEKGGGRIIDFERIRRKGNGSLRSSAYEVKNWISAVVFSRVLCKPLEGETIEGGGGLV